MNFMLIIGGNLDKMSVCFIQVLSLFQQPFRHIVAVFGCSRDLDALTVFRVLPY